MKTKALFIGTALSVLTGCATTLPTVYDVDVNNLEENQSVLIFFQLVHTKLVRLIPFKSL